MRESSFRFAQADPSGASTRESYSVSRPHLITLFLISVAISTGCSPTSEKPAPLPPEVTVTTVVQRDVPIHQEWVGTMAGNVDADIRPKVDGFLISQFYKEGSYEQKGQPLYQLDKRQAQAAVEQAQGDLARAQASLHQAEIDVRRYTPLVELKAVSQAELDKARSSETAATAQVAAVQAVLDNTQLNLGWTTVTAPISGIAGISKVQIGDLMTPSTTMTTISNVDPIYVDINIAEQDYLRFVREKTGRAAAENLELILGDGTVYPKRGHVLFVNRELNPLTGTIQVRGEFPNPGNVLRPGQYGRIRAVTEVRKNALLIPQPAVSELQGVYLVGVVSADNTATMKTVQLGPQFEDMWVVNSGLQVGDKVIVEGLQRVKNGMAVNPAPFKDTQAKEQTAGN